MLQNAKSNKQLFLLLALRSLRTRLTTKIFQLWCIRVLVIEKDRRLPDSLDQ